jgi:hypothetical protein
MILSWRNDMRALGRRTRRSKPWKRSSPATVPSRWSLRSIRCTIRCMATPAISRCCQRWDFLCRPPASYSSRLVAENRLCCKVSASRVRMG